jgi:hypothetical protein
MKLEVVPYSHIGKASLEKPPSELRSVFSNDYSTQITKPLKRTTDYFLDASIQVEYDEANESAFIGASQPNAPLYNHINLIDLSLEEIKNRFGTIDNNIYTEPNSILFLDTGLCFYFEEMENESKPQQIGIFKKGYYNFILHLYDKIVF